MIPKFCPKCGEPTKEGSKFCKKCGNPLMAAPQPMPQPIPAPAPQPMPQPAPAPAPQPMPQPTPAPAPQPMPQPAPAPAPQPMPQPAPAPAPQPSNMMSAMDEGERTVLLPKNDMPGSSFGQVPPQPTPAPQPTPTPAPQPNENTLHLRQNNQPPVRPMPSQQPPMGGGYPPMGGQPGRQVPPPVRGPVPQQQPPKKSGNGAQTAIIVVLIIILLAVLGVGGWLIYEHLIKQDDPSDKPESSNSSYELVKADISWEEAKEKAEKKGGYLACIEDKDEEEKIIEYLNDEGEDLKIVYIGGERDGDDFEWVNGDEFSYTDWTPGEPNNANNVEQYVCLYNKDMVNNSWGWNDCTNEMYKDYGGQFTGYTAYLIEYEEDDDDRDKDDDDRDDEDEE